MQIKSLYYPSCPNIVYVHVFALRYTYILESKVYRIVRSHLCNRALLCLSMIVLVLFIRSHDMLLFPILRMNMLSVGPIVLQFIVPLLLTLVHAYMNTP